MIVETLRLELDKELLGFKEVTKEMLEEWIGESPKDVRIMVKYLLATVKGSRLPRP
jgi:hypothetical protein